MFNQKDEEESKEISQRIEKWKLKKEIRKKQNKKIKCPYCAKEYVNKA